MRICTVSPELRVRARTYARTHARTHTHAHTHTHTKRQNMKIQTNSWNSSTTRPVNISHLNYLTSPFSK